MNRDLTATSRFLAYVLRHNPAAIGVSLDDGGWVGIDTLLAGCVAHGHPLNHDILTRS